MSGPPILAVGQEPPPLVPAPARPPDRAKGTRASVGRFQCVNAFIDATMGGLTPAERSAWLILWRDTKPNGLAATSQTSMARRAGVSDRSIRTALRGLERRRLLTVVHRGSLRSGVSIYRVRPLAEAGFRSPRK
jgi:hypothetical protein